VTNTARLADTVVSRYPDGPRGSQTADGVAFSSPLQQESLAQKWTSAVNANLSRDNYTLRLSEYRGRFGRLSTVAGRRPGVSQPSERLPDRHHGRWLPGLFGSSGALECCDPPFRCLSRDV